MTIRQVCLSLFLAAAATSVSATTPIGTLQSEGQFQVVAASGDKPFTINQSEYTFFAGDTVIASGGDAVLNLDGGGGLGFPRGSRVTVTQTDNAALVIEILDGNLLYAFPEGRANFVFHAGNFTIRRQAPEARSIQVARGSADISPEASTRDETMVGTIELLTDGNIKVSVRSGALEIRNGDAVRYQVAAGESVGLLDLPNQTVEVQAAAVQSATGPAVRPLVLIQSPERVGTNEDFLIRWEAFEPVDGDYLVIAKSGAEPDEFESLVNSDEGNELEFEAPGSPGDYEIRFIDGETGEIKRFVYLDVVEEIIGAYWWDNRIVGPAITVGAGAAAVYIIGRGSDDPDPVSP